MLVPRSARAARTNAVDVTMSWPTSDDVSVPSTHIDLILTRLPSGSAVRSFPPCKAEPAWRGVGRVFAPAALARTIGWKTKHLARSRLEVGSSWLRASAGSRPRTTRSNCLGWEAGAANRTRTCDPVITNDVLYQLSYCGGPNAASGVSRKRPHLISGTAPIGKKNAGPTKRFRATSAPLRVKKTRQNNKLEP